MNADRHALLAALDYANKLEQDNRDLRQRCDKAEAELHGLDRKYEPFLEKPKQSRNATPEGLAQAGQPQSNFKPDAGNLGMPVVTGEGVPLRDANERRFGYKDSNGLTLSAKFKDARGEFVVAMKDNGLPELIKITQVLPHQQEMVKYWMEGVPF